MSPHSDGGQRATVIAPGKQPGTHNVVAKKYIARRPETDKQESSETNKVTQNKINKGISKEQQKKEVII